MNMGINENAMTLTSELPRGVHVVASEKFLGGIRGLSDDLILLSRSTEDALTPDELASASTVVVEVDPASPNSLDRVNWLRQNLPNVPVIAGLANVDVATSRQLLRRGVADIIALPFAIDELAASIVDTAERNDVKVEAERPLAPMIAVLKSIGGSGATTIATHLASRMASDMGHDYHALVVDLDLQSGDATSYLGCHAKLTLQDLLEADKRLDEDLLRSVRCTTQSQVDVISAPLEIMPIEAIEYETLQTITQLARRHYDLVVLDLPAAFTNWSLSAVFGATKTLLVSTLTIPSLRHAKRQIDFLKSMGIAREDICVVLNKVENRLFKSIGTHDAETALKHPILANVHEDEDLLQSAQDQGQLAWDIQKKSKFGKDLDLLAEAVALQLSPEAE